MFQYLLSYQLLPNTDIPLRINISQIDRPQRANTGISGALKMTLSGHVKHICVDLIPYHDDAVIWKQFLHYWPFLRGTTYQQWIPITEGQWWRALIFVVRMSRLLKNQSFCRCFKTPWNSADTTVMPTSWCPCDATVTCRTDKTKPISPCDNKMLDPSGQSTTNDATGHQSHYGNTLAGWHLLNLNGKFVVLIETKWSLHEEIVDHFRTLFRMLTSKAADGKFKCIVLKKHNEFWFNSHWTLLGRKWHIAHIFS